MTSNTTTTIVPTVIASRKSDSCLSTREYRQGWRNMHDTRFRLLLRVDVKTRSSFHDLPALPKEVKPPGVYRCATIAALLRQTCLTECATKQSIRSPTYRKTFARSSRKRSLTSINYYCYFIANVLAWFKTIT